MTFSVTSRGEKRVSVRDAVNVYVLFYQIDDDALPFVCFGTLGVTTAPVPKPVQV